MLDFRKGIHQLQWENHPTNENYYTNNEHYYTNNMFAVIFIGWVVFDFNPSSGFRPTRNARFPEGDPPAAMGEPAA